MDGRKICIKFNVRTELNEDLLNEDKYIVCKLGIGIGSDMQKEPCVIIQNNIGNQRSGNTIVAPITHDDSKYPFLVPFTIQKMEW